jgi:SAM-dependent methyltransferase
MLQVKPPPARVLSIGCGVGLLDILLIGWGYQVTSLDSDLEVLEAARATGRSLGTELTLVHGDAFDLSEHHDRYDIAFSGGLVEHWHGQRTVELIREHARCAPLVQVEVPTVHTRIREAGGGRQADIAVDAYLHTPRQLARRVREAGLDVMRVYPVGDLPSFRYRALRMATPPYLFRKLTLATGYTMGVGCIGRRP